MSVWVIIILSFLASQLVLWLASTAIVSYLCIFNMRDRDEAAIKLPSEPKHIDVRERIFSLYYGIKNRPYEKAEILSRDELRLYARYYHVANGAPLVICFHGYKGSAHRDCYGMAKIALESGCNLLMPDQRAHGRSGGRNTTFGIRERFDCVDWVNYANQRFGAKTPILLYGVSMGGATVLMSNALNLPANVRGVISDCAFSSPMGIISKVTADFGMSTRWMIPPARLGAFLFAGGLRLKKKVCATEAVKQARVPILIFHGDADELVPYEMGLEIRDAAPERVELVTVKGAAHTHSYIVDTPRYERLVLEFMHRVIPEMGAESKGQ